MNIFGRMPRKVRQELLTYWRTQREAESSPQWAAYQDGMVAYYEKQLARAALHFARAATEDNVAVRVAALEMLSDVAEAQHLDDERAALMRRILAIDPHNIAAKCRLADAAKAKKDYAEAERLLMSALSDVSDPEDQHGIGFAARAYIDILRLTNRHPDIQPFVEALTIKYPNRPELRSLLDNRGSALS